MTRTWDPFGRPPPRQTLSTREGVRIIVQDQRPPEPEPEPEPPQPKVIIFPAGQPAHEREAFLNDICKRHGIFLDELLAHRRDVAEESRKDVRQAALLVLCLHVRKHDEAPESVRRFLRGVIKKVIRDRKDKWRPDVDPGADVDEALCASPDPEDLAEVTEERAKLERYIDQLPYPQQQAIRAVDLGDMTFDEAAVVLKRARGTVSTQVLRAREIVEELAKESARQTALGLRRTPG
jgi:RNA polymerase sigma factor (sigma-70 family)